MLHPSYSDLIEVVNSGGMPGEEPVVQSRYSIVMATAKRARQLIATKMLLYKKPLSIAIDDLYKQRVKIVAEGDIEKSADSADDKNIADEGQ
ncbi:DNA-directed RNA polymerase subunit omega [Johnsonella ignava]|mgnify:FL=1|uniref:DNA-directed RNA polymerase subunit omega n=1 Tax=Johnsonella ignava TaxID=43995 RepID=UPI0023F35CCC|nr:DNA-directed RNA polymerase subunit omega [Johnsonella ignava]